MSRDLRLEPARLSGTAHTASATTISPKGIFIQNAQRHVAFVVSHPPTSGPIAAMPPMVEPHTAKAIARSLPTKIALRLESVAGSRKAAPMPWRSLAAMSVAPESAAPASTDAIMKIATPVIRNLRLPQMSLARPETRRSDAKTSE